MKIRIGDATYSAPFRASSSDAVYRAGTWLATVAYDDGDRFVTAISKDVLAAFFDAYVTGDEYESKGETR